MPKSDTTKISVEEIRTFMERLPRGQNKQAKDQSWCVATSAGATITAGDLIACYVARTRSYRLHRLVKAVENQTAKDGSVWTLWTNEEVPFYA
jgi:hypothetical protein